MTSVKFPRNGIPGNFRISIGSREASIDLERVKGIEPSS